MGIKISGCFATSNLDTHGERIEIEGLDISSLAVDGKAIFEHKKDLPSQIVGRILFAKKIYNEEDCDTEDQLKWWKTQEMPFVYGIVELFDGHDGAESIKAMLNHDLQNKDSNQRPMVGFSIDGQILEKDKSGVIKSAVARDVAVTTRPASKTAKASLYAEEKQIVSPIDVLKHLFKNENNLGEVMDERQEKLNFLESLLKTDDISQLAKQKIKEHLDQIKNPSQQESINGRPRANLKNNGKPLTDRVPKAVPVPHRKQAYPNPFGPTSKQNIGQPRVISGDEFKAKIAAFKENAKKQNEELRNAYNEPKEKLPAQKIPSMGQQPVAKPVSTSITPATPATPKLSVIDGGKSEPKTSWVKEVRSDVKKSEEVEKTESAGMNNAPLGSKTNLSALADDLYKSWDKKERFEDFLQKKMPKLSKKEVKAITKAYLIKKNKDKEDVLKEI